jgi:putative glycosyltransferase (TIGR04372 family)
MKYGIWRHDDALGNSAEHVYGLSQYLNLNPDENAEIYVEHEFQKYFALCIPGITEKNIKFFPKVFDNLSVGDMMVVWNETLYKSDEFRDILMPSSYAWHGKTYGGMWEDLTVSPETKLVFPKNIYENKHNIPENTIVIQFREENSFWKRIDGSNSEPSRFVDIKTFFEIALHYANLGYKVYRIGDKNQTPMPIHENKVDFAMFENKNILDDLYLLSKSKVFISTDSGLWPMVAGMKKNMVLTNMTSCRFKMSIVDWLPKETTIVHFKKDFIHDNTIDEIINSTNKFL